MSLKGKNGLIVDIANRNSVAYGCAEVLRAAGAELAVTYLNAKAEPFVRPLAEHLGSPIVIACDAAWLGVDLDQSAKFCRRNADYAYRQPHLGLGSSDGRRSDDRPARVDIVGPRGHTSFAWK